MADGVGKTHITLPNDPRAWSLQAQIPQSLRNRIFSLRATRRTPGYREPCPSQILDIACQIMTNMATTPTPRICEKHATKICHVEEGSYGKKKSYIRCLSPVPSMEVLTKCCCSTLFDSASACLGWPPHSSCLAIIRVALRAMASRPWLSQLQVLSDLQMSLGLWHSCLLSW